MKMDFLPKSVLKISALTFAIAATASCTAMATGTDHQTASATSSTAITLGNAATTSGTMIPLPLVVRPMQD